MIIPALPADHNVLTTLTQQSKAHWGYAAEQMKKWEADLTITPNYITQNSVFKLIVAKEIVGYYSLIHKNSTTIELDNLFIHPLAIKKGYGSRLLTDAMKRSHQMKYKKMILHADPHATEFYLKKGFVIIGQLATSIPKRYLPIMEKKV